MKEIISVYNTQFGLALHEQNKSDGNFNLEMFAKTLNENFNKGIEEITENERNLENSSIAISENFSIQPFLNELFTQLMAIEDGDKASTLKKMENIVQQNIEMIKVDDLLTSDEKQFIIENYILRSGIFLTHLKYGDEIDKAVGINANKSELKRCGWFCRNKIRIECLAISITAAGACGVAVAALTPPMTLSSLVMSSFCVTWTNLAIACWTRWDNL